ncbi:MAG: PrsW family glutamic-type intramembrane protease [Candidatus Hodarchaeota archaeon]
MYSIGILLGILISLLYPLGIAIIFKILKFEDKFWKFFLIAFLLGALFFYIGLIRVIFTSLAPLPALYWVNLIVGAFIEECMKLLVIFLLLRKINPNEENGKYFGLIVGLGFGAGEMLNFIPAVPAAIINTQNAIVGSFIWLQIFHGTPLEALYSFNILYYSYILVLYTSSINLFGIPLLALYERFIVVLFHSATAIIIGYSFEVDHPTLDLKKITLTPIIIYYLLMSGLHIFLNLWAILFHLGVLSIVVIELIITAISIPSFFIAMRMLLKT